MIPTLSAYNQSTSFIEMNDPEGIAIQSGIYIGLLLCIICACCCTRRYCLRPPTTDFIAQDITNQEHYGAVQEAAKNIIHRRYESEIGHQPDTLSQREVSILEELSQQDELDETDLLQDTSEYTVHDGSEPDLMEVNLTDGESL